MISTVAAKWSWSWCRRATSRRGSGRRRRAGGGVYLTGYGTPLAETGDTGNRRSPLRAGVPDQSADFALIKATQGDRWNSFGLSQGGAQLARLWRRRKTTIVEVSQLVARATSTRKHHHPGIFVQRVFSLENLTAAQRAPEARRYQN